MSDNVDSIIDCPYIFLCIISIHFVTREIENRKFSTIAEWTFQTCLFLLLIIIVIIVIRLSSRNNDYYYHDNVLY